MNFAIFMTIVAAIVQALDVIVEVLEKDHSKTRKITEIAVKCLVILGLCYLAYTEIVEKQLNDDIAAKHGEFGKQKDSSGKPPLVKLGPIGISGFAKLASFIGQYTHPIDAYPKNGQLSLYADIRDSKGDMIASIRGREWKIDNDIGIDYNNDDSAFEVVTSDDRVVFQIVLKRDTVLCNGMICSEYGRCIFFDDGKGMYQDTSSKPLPQRFVLPVDYDRPSIFKYPRYRYLHVRNNPQDVVPSK